MCLATDRFITVDNTCCTSEPLPSKHVRQKLRAPHCMHPSMSTAANGFAHTHIHGCCRYISRKMLTTASCGRPCRSPGWPTSDAVSGNWLSDVRWSLQEIEPLRSPTCSYGEGRTNTRPWTTAVLHRKKNLRGISTEPHAQLAEVSPIPAHNSYPDMRRTETLTTHARTSFPLPVYFRAKTRMQPIPPSKRRCCGLRPVVLWLVLWLVLAEDVCQTRYWSRPRLRHRLRQNLRSP